MAILPTIYGNNNSLAASDGFYFPFNTAAQTQTEVFPFRPINQLFYGGETSGADIRGLTFSVDGTKLYTTTMSSSVIRRWDLATAWNISTAVIAQTVTLSSTWSAGIDISDDGTQLLISSITNGRIDRYTLSTAWDLTTATQQSDTLSLISVGNPEDLYASPDGTKIYVIGFGTDAVHQFNLSTAWDLSTGTAAETFSVESQDGNAYALTFSPNGEHFYITGQGSFVHQYTMSTPWNITTASFVSTSTYSMYRGRGIGISQDGTKLYVANTGTSDLLRQFDLSTPWSISTGAAAVLDSPWPVNLQTIDALTWTAESARSASGGDDVMDLLIRVVNGATVLAAADAGGTFQTIRSNITGTANVTSGPTAFGYVNTGASKALWDGASIELQQAYSRNMGADGHGIVVDLLALNGTYTPTIVEETLQNIRLGDKTVNAIYLGDTAVTKVYLGDVLVFG